jgi:hypothetical protein
MKERIAVLVLVSLMLSACGAANESQAETRARGALPPMTEVLVGTLRLDGTEQAVSIEQAAELLPLWEIYQELSSSDTVASAELEALNEQIQEVMTPQQRDAIRDMELTQEDVLALMREQGFDFAARRTQDGEGSSDEVGPGPGGGFFGGEMPPGGLPDEGGPMPGQGLFGGGVRVAGTQTAGGTEGSAVQPRAASDRVPPPLLQALIQYLQEKAAT